MFSFTRIRSAVRFTCLFSLFAASLIATSVQATEGVPLGNKSIYLQGNDDSEFFFGHVEFSKASDGMITYSLDVDTERLKDFFLSMKEMKCLEGKEIWCFIPYPYEHPNQVSASDLRWLEHDLLFMYKALNAFGANLWNGIYYAMEVKDGKIRGVAKAVDLNYIAGPPDDLSTPPYGEFDIGETEATARWLPFIEIR